MKFIKSLTAYSLFIITLFASCSNEPGKTIANTKKETLEDKAAKSVDSIHNAAMHGDLIVRLGDDLLSEQIRYLSEKDQSFSHAGIIIDSNGKKLVCHITPDVIGADTVRFEPLDTFINPTKNVFAGIYRYEITNEEKAKFINNLRNYHKSQVTFDRLYDFDSENKVYCSEMIVKSLAAATNNRISFKQIKLPRKLLPFMYAYFKDEKVSRKRLEEGTYVSLDNLYMIPECREVTKLRVKFFN